MGNVFGCEHLQGLGSPAGPAWTSRHGRCGFWLQMRGLIAGPLALPPHAFPARSRIQLAGNAAPRRRNHCGAWPCPGRPGHFKLGDQPQPLRSDAGAVLVTEGAYGAVAIPLTNRADLAPWVSPLALCSVLQPGLLLAVVGVLGKQGRRRSSFLRSIQLRRLPAPPRADHFPPAGGLDGAHLSSR